MGTRSWATTGIAFITQIPKDWIKSPKGDDPDHDDQGGDENGGIDKDIPAPDWGKSPIEETSKETIADVVEWATDGEELSATCPDNPVWRGAGKIALGGIGSNGDWKYKKNWIDEGKIASGLGWENKYVRLHDMNGDGKAGELNRSDFFVSNFHPNAYETDYVWVHPESGEIRCWLNNMPEPWSPAGNNNAVIGSGVTRSERVYLAVSLIPPLALSLINER